MLALLLASSIISVVAGDS
jgi:hypothetical protein